MTQKILDLPLKKKWYSMYESGIKNEEYRETKNYWQKRILGRENCLFNFPYRCDVNVKGYTHARLRYGYTKRTMLREIESITVGYGNPEWGAPTDRQVFIIKFKQED
jgi:hypothetical protein